MGEGLKPQSNLLSTALISLALLPHYMYAYGYQNHQPQPVTGIQPYMVLELKEDLRANDIITWKQCWGWKQYSMKSLFQGGSQKQPNYLDTDTAVNFHIWHPQRYK